MSGKKESYIGVTGIASGRAGEPERGGRRGDGRRGRRLINRDKSFKIRIVGAS